jgi:FkbM family methyltransferase
MGEHEIVVPLNCLPGFAEVFSGQYPLGFTGLPDDLVILDIGANCGAFSLACLQRWPRAKIHAYEPHPGIFRYLAENLCKLGVTCYDSAVGNPTKNQFHFGIDNDLCGSQYMIGRQERDTVTVPVLHPSFLPQAHLVKIDTEGAECDIVGALVFTPAVLIVEWHTEDNRRSIDATVSDSMRLASSAVHGRGWGVNVYIRHQEAA